MSKLDLQLLCHTCHLTAQMTCITQAVTAFCAHVVSCLQCCTTNISTTLSKSQAIWPAQCCLQRADMHMVSLGAHVPELTKCPCTIHQMRLKHTFSIVIQNCTGAATSRLKIATIIFCTQEMLGRTFHSLNTCIMHRKLSFNSPLKSVSICLHRPPTSYNMLHQVSSP